MATVKIDPTKCNGSNECGECINACPTGVFEIEGNKIKIKEISECIGCHVCEGVCPGGAITVED